jgi:hypothetical protein
MFQCLVLYLQKMDIRSKLGIDIYLDFFSLIINFHLVMRQY